MNADLSTVVDLLGEPLRERQDRSARYRARYPQRITAAQLAWRARNKDKMAAASKARRARWSPEEKQRRGRASNLKHVFGITLKQYEALLVQQGGACAICCDPETAMRNGRIKRLAVDHEHTTGAIRGLLCQNCNTMLGKGRDRITLLTLAIEYLKRYAL